MNMKYIEPHSETVKNPDFLKNEVADILYYFRTRLNEICWALILLFCRLDHRRRPSEIFLLTQILVTISH